MVASTLSSFCLSPARAASPAAQEAEFRQRIEETRKRLAAEAAMPEDKRWDLEEQHLRDLENRAVEGDTRSTQFLLLAEERMAKMRRARFEKTWGRLLNHPDATEELRTHALRAAELRRLRILAHGRKYPALEQRALDLTQAEWARHERRMQAIAADVGAPVGNGSAPSSGTETPEGGK